MKKIIKEINPLNNIEPENKLIYILKILLKTFIVYFASLIIAEAIVILLHYPLGYNPTGNPMPMDVLLIATYYGYLVTITMFILLVKKIDKETLKEIGINKNLKTIFKGFFLGVISLFIIISLLILMKQITFEGINNNINYLMIILFMFGYLIQSIMEEIICRGYLLHKLKKKVPTFLAVIISFMFFSVFHFSKLFEDGIILGLIGCLNLFLISMIWTILSLNDKNIYGAISFHFIWNFVLFSIIGLNLSGLETSNSILKFSSNNGFLSGASYGIESSIITSIILFIILIINRKKIKQ